MAVPGRVPSRRERTVIGALATILFLVGWEALVRIGRIPEVLLPPPTSIGAYLAGHMGLLLQHAWVTVFETVAGFLLALVVGLVLAVGIVWSPRFEAAVNPFIVTLQVVPKVAVAPLVVVYLGLGLEPKVFLSFLVSFFPIVINTTLGLTSGKVELDELLLTLRASRWQVLYKVQIFQALPYVIAASKVTITLAVIGAIVGEFVAARQGLGYLIASAAPQLNTQLIFSAVIVLTVIGIVLYQAINLLGHALTPWLSRGPDAVTPTTVA